MNLQAINAYVNNLNNSNIVSDDTAVNASKEAESASNLQALLGNAQRGDYLQGLILSKNGDNVQISLGPDMTIDAKINAGANLMEGASVVFAIKAMTGNGLFLSPLYTNTDASSTIATALESAGLENNERNMSIVGSMIREGMSIKDDEVIAMAKALGNIDTVDIPDAVTLSKLGIEPTNDNVLQFNAYLGYEHQVSDAVNDIMELVPDTLKQMVMDGEINEAVNMTRDILDIFTLQGAMEPFDSEALVRSGMDIPVNEILTTEELDTLTKLLSDNGIDEAFGAVMKEGGVSFMDTLYVIDDLINKASDERPGTENELVDTQDFLRRLNSSLGKDVTGDIELADKDKLANKLSELITSKPLESLIKNAVNNQWKLTPEQVGEEKEVSNLYKRMTEQTVRLLETLDNHSKQDSMLAIQSNDLSKNMNFMNELNNMFNYVQLPMKLQGNDAHGELYVYTNKKNLASNDGNVSALLHLDMDNLGPTDIYVAMNSSNHVNTHFYLPDEEALDLIALHIDELNARLEKRGYFMKAELTTRDDNTNIMQKIVEENKSQVPIAYSNFDAKA